MWADQVHAAVAVKVHDYDQDQVNEHAMRQRWRSTAGRIAFTGRLRQVRNHYSLSKDCGGLDALSSSELWRAAEAAVDE